MENHRLYKNKYLIAVYDERDFCIGVYDNLKELRKITKYADLNQAIYRGKVAREKIKIYLINCFETHNDIFKSEDKQFINFLKTNGIGTNEQKSKWAGISRREYFRKKRIFNQKEVKNGNKNIWKIRYWSFTSK